MKKSLIILLWIMLQFSLVNAKTINGTNNPDTIQGTKNDDIINGYLGGDTIFGDFGKDTINGGADSDKLIGGQTNEMDTLIGGAGYDEFNIQRTSDFARKMFKSNPYSTYIKDYDKQRDKILLEDSYISSLGEKTSSFSDGICSISIQANQIKDNITSIVYYFFKVNATNLSICNTIKNNVQKYSEVYR